MDQTLLVTLAGLAMNAVILIFVVLSYFRRLATKDDIKALSDRLGNVEEGQAGLASRQAALEARQTALEARQTALETRIDGIDDAIREVNEKADISLALHREVSVELRVMQASILRLESYFETPKLKSS